MKMKLNLSGGGIQNFFIQHVEKLCFGIAVLLVIMFVYFGWSLDSYQKTPDQLKSVAQSARSHIANDTWEQVKEDREPPTGYVDDVQKGLQPTLATSYETPLPLKPPTRSQHIKRQDPELFPPVKLLATASVGAVLLKEGQGREDLLAAADNAGQQEVDEAARKREEARKKREARRNRNRGDGGGGPPGMGPPGFAAGGENDPPPDGGIGDIPGIPGIPGIGGGDGIFGTGGGVGGPAAARGTVRKYPENLAEGYRPGATSMPGSGGMASGPDGMRPQGPGSAASTATSGPVPVSTAFVCVKALVPYEKQFDEFERTLGGQFFEPGRDTPKFIYLWVQRAEVTSDPDAPLKWVQLRTSDAENFAQEFAGVPGEVAEYQYRDNTKICQPVPPLLLRPLDDLLTHPDLPKRESAIDKPEEPAAADDPEPGTGNDLPTGDFPTASSSGGRPGLGSGPPGLPGMADPFGAGGDTDPPPSSSGFPGMMSGPGGMPGMGGGVPGRGGVAAAPKPKYKLVRFFDFTVKPGKTYKYQIKLFVEDPNNPNPKGRYAAPNSRTLAKEVTARLNDPARNKAEFWRTTEWSEESPAVTVPTPGELVAGPVELPRLTRIHEEVIQLDEPEGDFVPVVWDAKMAADVPVARRVTRGSVLNFKDNAEVVHPVSLIIKVLKDYEFKTNAYIVDLRGGDELPGEGDGEEPLTAPGEFALIDGSGNLVVRNELDNVDSFRRHTLAFEQENPPAAGPGSGPEGMPGMGPPGGGGFDPGSFYGTGTGS